MFLSKFTLSVGSSWVCGVSSVLGFVTQKIMYCVCKPRLALIRLSGMQLPGVLPVPV